jgi:pimeloyl-ACP methyl ester carboxylesterase
MLYGFRVWVHGVFEEIEMNCLLIPDAKTYIRFHDLTGTGPAIVMLHGLGSASSVDYPTVTHYAELRGHRFVLPDFLGFGFSDKPKSFDYSLSSHAKTIYLILRSLGIKEINLFGHSMGGAIAVALAAAHPELVMRLTLAEANLDPGIGQISKTITEQTEKRYVTEGHMRFLRRIKAELPNSPSFGAYAGALAMADPIAMYRSTVGLIQGTVPAQRELFLSMRIPRAFIFGQNSLPDPDVEGLKSQGIQVLIVPNAGHGMMHDNPEGFGQALMQSFYL